ncbi:condensation domain-containing protein, partial [Frankia sp. KB5]|uniref:condensation domain-containing protein n=1 Tax=Frankia sp. KB5 TaxID=683318 RepID=UPI000A232F77
MTSTQPVEIDPQSWDDLDALRTDVATLLGLTDAEDLGLDEDLLSVGLESLTLIQLVTRWRAAGIDVDFAEFAEAPTVREWARILSQAPRTGGAEPTESADPEPAEPEFAEAVGEPFPLATMQHAYWVGRQPGQPFGGVAAHFYVEFDGTGIDPERLRRAFAALVARHGMLRSRVTEDGRAMIGEVTEPRLPVRDLRQLPPAEVEERLAALRSDYTHRMMDVEAGEICEVALTLLPDSATRLHLDLDMVASDALSLRLLFEDLRKLYLASPPAVAGPAEDSAHAEDSAPPPLTYDFPRYLADRAARGDDRVVRARQWWQDRLDDLPEAPDLPLRPGAGEPTTVARSTRLDHWIDPGRRAVLTERARRHGVTPAVTLATAFAEVIGAWSAGPRFLLNLPLFDRDPLHPDVDLLVGDFSSSLLLDIDLGEPLPFAERARSVGQNLAAAIGHGSYSGVEVLRELSRRRGHPVLAPVVYTSALGLGDIYSQAVQECFGRPAWTISQGPQVWLDAQVTEHDGGLLLNWDVRLDCLGEGVAQEAFAAYRALVDRLAGSDDPWQAPVGALLPAAQTTVRAEVNATRRENPVRTLHEIVFRWAAAELGEAGAEESADGARHPAVIAGDRRLGYAELADAALRVAALLVDEG